MTWEEILKEHGGCCECQKCREKMEKGLKIKCPKCEGKGCSHCDDKGYYEKPSRGRGFTR